eukprot:g1861.t1
MHRLAPSLPLPERLIEAHTKRTEKKMARNCQREFCRRRTTSVPPEKHEQEVSSAHALLAWLPAKRGPRKVGSNHIRPLQRGPEVIQHRVRVVPEVNHHHNTNSVLPATGKKQRQPKVKNSHQNSALATKKQREPKVNSNHKSALPTKNQREPKVKNSHHNSALLTKKQREQKVNSHQRSALPAKKQRDPKVENSHQDSALLTKKQREPMVNSH